MKRRFAGTIAAFAAAAALLAPAASRSTPEVLDRMAAVNPNLHTFTATIHAHVAMLSFPFLSADLGGTYYFAQPDKNKVAFTSGVPMVASQFDKLYANVEPPSRWRDLYTVTVVGDDGSSTRFRLVPRKRGNVDSIDATADDATATVTTMRWNYANGGYAQMTNRYRRIDGNFVVAAQTGHVQEPGYVADVGTTIDGYKLNVSLPDGIFTSP